MIKADFNLSANFNIKKQAALDPRFVVATKAELIDENHWAHDGSTYYVYEGLLVAVADTGKVFMLTDKTKLLNTDYSGWIDVTGSAELPAASSTTAGIVKLGSDTIQSVDANSVSNVASRTYAVQQNNNDQLVVNVPWSDSFAGKESEYANIANATVVSVVDPIHDDENGILNFSYKEIELSTGAEKSFNTEIPCVSKEFVSNSISDAISDVTQFEYEVVESLPESGVKGTIYLKAATDAQGNDVYEEYIYINEQFEKLGTTNTIDLTGYLKNSDELTINNGSLTINGTDGGSISMIEDALTITNNNGDYVNIYPNVIILNNKEHDKNIVTVDETGIHFDNIDGSDSVSVGIDVINAPAEFYGDNVYWNTKGGCTKLEAITTTEINSIFA